MATRTWAISKDHSTAGGAVDYGNANDNHHPVGLWSGWTYRAFMQFAVDTSGMASISSAILYMRSTSQVHVGFGSDPDPVVQRLTSSWSSSGGSEASWTSGASFTRSSEPSATSTGQAQFDATVAESTWDTCSITAIAQAWLAGSANYGVRVISADAADTAETWEFSSMNSAYDPYIVVTYTATVTNTAPTVTAVSPSADVATMNYTAGSAWASPRPTLSWTFSDVDTADSQIAYQAIIYADSAGSVGAQLYDSGKITSTATSLVPVYTFTEGDYYHWKVMVWDKANASSAWSSTLRFRTRWGAAEYVWDTGSTPTAWGAVTKTSAGNIAIEYNSTTATGDPGTGLMATWQANLSTVTLQRYLRYRVWLLPGSVAPTLSDVTITWTDASVPIPDNWDLTNATEATCDTSTLQYGTRSLRLLDGWVEQQVNVKANTRYMISAYVRQSGGWGDHATIFLQDAATLTDLVAGDLSSVDDDYSSFQVNEWQHIYFPWESGTVTSVILQLSNSSAAYYVWFDAVLFEESNKITPWKPSTISGSVVLDAAGIKIDASEGGTLRLRGSTGGTRDTIELGANGLDFGGDANLYSSVADVLRTDDSFDIGDRLRLSGIITPTALAAATNNWNPTGLTTAGYIRISASAAYNLTGISAGTAGDMLVLSNVGTFTISILDNNAGSTLANRFQTAGGTTVSLTARRTIMLIYDGTLARWMVIA